MCKRLFCLLLGLMLLSFPVCASAEEGVCFYLEDTEVSQNEVFKITLSADSSVAVFLAHLEFDENALEFKEAKALSPSAELSVNYKSGKITLAYLMESGAKDELIVLSFKAKNKNASISLKLEQVVDSMGNEVFISSVKDAEITLTQKPAKITSDKNTQKSPSASAKSSSDISETDPTALASADESYFYLPAKNSRYTYLIISAVGGFTITLGIGVIAFILGRGTNKTNEKDKHEKNS
ncbi:MAG: hypothetical protein IJF19_01075 [Clostridia bacterium]|nr:hypothetical protein [Clostridia bacterium]